MKRNSNTSVDYRHDSSQKDSLPGKGWLQGRFARTSLVHVMWEHRIPPRPMVNFRHGFLSRCLFEPRIIVALLLSVFCCVPDFIRNFKRRPRQGGAGC